VAAVTTNPSIATKSPVQRRSWVRDTGLYRLADCNRHSKFWISRNDQDQDDSRGRDEEEGGSPPGRAFWAVARVDLGFNELNMSVNSPATEVDG